MTSTRRSRDRLENEQTSNTTPTADGDVTPALLTSLEWRSIGPYRGGRVVAVAGDPAHAQVFYFGSTGGGVWKTSDGGVYWENISDGFFKRASVGAIAVSASDPNVIYAGMGETTIRGNVSHGDGVYKSTDAGKTWMHLGLEDTRQIGKVRIHPQNLISCTSRHWAMLMGRIRSAESIARAMAARPGSKSSSPVKTSAPMISRWIRTTRAFSTPRSGGRGACHIPCNPGVKAAASSSQPTAVIPGPI